MSSYPAGPPATTRRRGFNFGGVLVLLGILCVVGFFIYNMVPNLVSSILPGHTDGTSGEWVGLVKYKPGMMSSTEQPAALKITLKPTELTSIVPQYKMLAELRIAGHTTPLTVEADKLIGGHSIKGVNGITDSASDPGFNGAIVSGDIKDKQLKLEIRAMGAGTDASFEGTLTPGTDADFDAVLKQLQ